MKLITVLIPAYNTERYLSRCLDSLTYSKDILDSLDIIIVNDGSTDNTLDLANTYKELFPDTISVINKENGGHGSTINAGLSAARGKYFRVVDSDDWVNIDDFSNFVKSLKKTDADFIVTSYQERHLYDESVRELIFTTADTDKDQKIPITQIVDSLEQPNFFFKFSMHSMTVRTKALRNVWGDGLLEKTFYVDQQYVAKILSCAKNFQIANYDIYRYFIGRPEQSVGMDGFYRHRQNHERVLRWLLETLNTFDEANHVHKVLHKQISCMLRTHYEIYYQKPDAPKEVVEELITFDKFLQNNFPEIHANIPAARNVKHRLSAVRRKIKQNTLEKWR